MSPWKQKHIAAKTKTGRMFLLLIKNSKKNLKVLFEKKSIESIPTNPKK